MFFIGIAGISSGENQVILIFSTALAAFGVSGFFSKRNVEGIQVDWDVSGRIFAGDPVLCRVIVKNPRFYPRFAIWLSSSFFKKFLPYIKARGEESFLVPITFKKRGWNSLTGLEVSSSFPSGMVERKFFYTAKKKVLVYPRIHRVYPHFPPRIVGEGFVEIHYLEGEDFSHLREVQEADVRRVYWKATARLDRLVEMVRSSPSGGKVIIVLDSYVKSQQERFEENISLLASLGFYLIENSIEHKIIFKDFTGEISPENLDEFLKKLALLEPITLKQSRQFLKILHRELSQITPFLLVNEEDSPFLDLKKKYRLVLVKR